MPQAEPIRPDPRADRYVLRLDQEAATVALARRVGALAGAGDTLLLEGPIGAGKSFFARALIQSRLAAEGRMEDVPSPTFTLVQTYALADLEIWHADLYRLSDPDELAELGLEEAFGQALCLVEWPARLGRLTPQEALWLRFRSLAGPEERQVTLEGGPRWAPLFAALRTDAGAGGDG